MARFPTVDTLASATPADVLRAWAGLGYDRRALALWRTARVIVEVHGGRVPASVKELETLPGVGPYTARAIASLAYGVPVGAVDVNVRRVLSRIVAGDVPPLPAATIQAIADASVPTDAPGAWTHAVMDVGATLCKPRIARCDACPARPWCRFAREATEATRPTAGPPRPAPATDRPPTTWPAPDRPALARPRSPRPTAGSAAGSWIGFAPHPVTPGRPSRARSGSTATSGYAPRLTPWRSTASSNWRRATMTSFERGCRWRDAPRLGTPYACPTMPATRLTIDPNGPAGAPPLPANDPAIFELDLRGLRRRWAASAALPPIGAEAMTGADRRAQALGVSEERLMEHAGTAVAAAVKALAVDTDRWGTGPIVILCGPGNNGGDGFVAARRLALAGARVVVAVIAAEGRPRNAASARNWDRIAGDEGIAKIHAPVRSRRRGLRPGDREGIGHRRCAARHRGPRGAARPDPCRGGTDRAGSGDGHPGGGHRYTDRAWTCRAVNRLSPQSRPTSRSRSIAQRPGLLTRRGAASCRQGARRAHRHPVRGRPWLRPDRNPAGARCWSSPLAVVAVVLGAAIVTSVLPRDVQDAIFHRPVLIAVLVIGTGWLLWRISRPRPSTDGAPTDRPVDASSGPDEGGRP